MKLKFAIYAVLAVSIVFAGAMIYVVHFGNSEAPMVSALLPVVNDPGKTVSGKEGKLIVAYAGDLAGNLEPCG